MAFKRETANHVVIGNHIKNVNMESRNVGVLNVVVEQNQGVSTVDEKGHARHAVESQLSYVSTEDKNIHAKIVGTLLNLKKNANMANGKGVVSFVESQDTNVCMANRNLDVYPVVENFKSFNANTEHLSILAKSAMENGTVSIKIVIQQSKKQIRSVGRVVPNHIQNHAV
jgi:hypothetical protein